VFLAKTIAILKGTNKHKH